MRQLEFYLGPAVGQSADTVLITGAVQSNFVRLCAAAAARLGLQAVVQLEKRVDKDDDFYNRSGNVLLDQLLGAQIHYFDQGDDEAAADANLDRMAREISQSGRKPFVVHLGIDHPPVGALGYSACAAECLLQLRDASSMPDHVVIPSGSGLTHAGFLAGARACGWDVPVHGICVRREAPAQLARIRQRANEVCEMLGAAGCVGERDVIVDDSVLKPGYGQLNQSVMDAILSAARLEGLLLDPVYSGRTMAGLFALVAAGTIRPGESVLFIHTGGLPSLFAYQNDLANGLQQSFAS